MSGPHVVALARSSEHAFTKFACEKLELVEGLGVQGDAHAGTTVKHRSRVRKDPSQPNLRQVHLIHAELFDELADKGFNLNAGDLGENVLTRGIPLLDLPTGTLLLIGPAAVRITGLRNPCWQIDAFSPGLLAEMIDKLPDGTLRRKCGVMGVVERGGEIAAGMPVAIIKPDPPHRPLEPV